jgi:DNA-binding beta-propeller fold protein YncE
MAMALQPGWHMPAPSLYRFFLPVLALAPAPGCFQDTGPCEASQFICPYAGNGEPAFNGDGHPLLQSSLYWPVDLDFASDGRAYLLDWQNHRVRRVNEDGRLETVMGNDLVGDGPPDASDLVSPGALGTRVELNHPTDLTFLPGGQVVVAAWHNHKVRALDPATGMVMVLAGSGPGKTGDGGPAQQALLAQPKSVVADAGGNIYVTDSRNQRIRRIDGPTGIIATIAGSGKEGFAGDGGRPLDASFRLQQPNENPEPGGNITLDAAGLIYVADTYNNRIRLIDLAAGQVTTVAGDGTAGFGGDGGPATAASLNHPRDVELGPDGRLFIADTDNHRVRAVDLRAGIIETVAGDGRAADDGDRGPARKAGLHRPFGIAFDAAGALYVADTFNHRIRRIAP